MRALAQRSAQAAKEISTLIGQTSTGVTEGNQRMSQAARTIEEMVQSVQRVSAQIEHISAGTQAQLQSLEQVNRAMQALDGVAHDNAAQVQASADMAHNLGRGAHSMERSVEVFHLA